MTEGYRVTSPSTLFGDEECLGRSGFSVDSFDGKANLVGHLEEGRLAQSGRLEKHGE